MNIVLAEMVSPWDYVLQSKITKKHPDIAIKVAGRHYGIFASGKTKKDIAKIDPKKYKPGSNFFETFINICEGLLKDVPDFTGYVKDTSYISVHFSNGKLDGKPAVVKYSKYANTIYNLKNGIAGEAYMRAYRDETYSFLEDVEMSVRDVVMDTNKHNYYVVRGAMPYSVCINGRNFSYGRVHRWFYEHDINPFEHGRFLKGCSEEFPIMLFEFDIENSC